MAENESILGVVIDPDKAESGSKRVNSALDKMESRGNEFARKFDSSVSSTFDKFAKASSSSFDKLQNMSSNAFSKLTSTSKTGADNLVKNYENAYKQVQNMITKTSKMQLDASKAALFQGGKIPTQTSGRGIASIIEADNKALRRAEVELDRIMTAFWAKQKSLPALLKASPGLDEAASKANQLFNTLTSALSRTSSTSSKLWGQISTGASSSFNNVTASASKAASNVQSMFQKAWANIKAGYDKVFGGSGGGSGGGGMFSGMGAWFAGAGIYLAIDQFVDKLVDANNTYNSFIATLKAGKLTGEQAGEEYQYLLNLANSMGVEFSSLTRSYAKFTAATMDSALAGKAAKEIFESIVTVSTVLHSKGYDTERMFYAITQSISKGRIYREELVQQLAEKLPGAMNLAAKSMGMNIKDLNKALTDGTLDVSEFWLKFSQGLKQAYGGAAAEAAQMVEANINRLKNAVEVAFVNMGQSGAIEGFINLLKSLTNVINSATSSSDYFGKTFGDMANMLADWINSLSPQDIDSVIKGVTTIFDAFVRSIKVFVGTVGDFGETKVTFIDFAESVSKAMLTVAGVMADTINLFKVLYTYMNEPVKPKIDMKGVSYAKIKREHPEWSDERVDVAMSAVKFTNGDKMAKYNKAMDEYNKNLSASWEAVGTGMDNAKKQSDEMTKLYGQLRVDNAKVTNKPFSEMPKVDLVVPQALSKGEFDELLANIMADPNYNNGKGKGDKAEERKKLSIMRAYWNERESQIKQLAKMQIDESNILANQNPLFEYNVRLTKEKIEADERLSKLSQTYKDKLLENAKAIDAQAIALENVKAVMSDYMQTYQQIITLQEKAAQLNSGGLKQFTEEDDARRSTMFGGANQYMAEDTKKQLVAKAKLRDDANIAFSMAQMGNDYNEELIQMRQRNDLIGMGTVLTQQMTAAFSIDNQIRKLSIGLTEEQKQKFIELGDTIKTKLGQEFFETLKKNMEFDLSEQIRELEFRNQLIGKTSVEQAVLNEQFRIEQMIRRETIGMTDEQKKKYQELASVIKDKLTKSIEDNAAIQRSASTGVKNGIANYIDEITNYAYQAQNTIMGLFHSLEDALTDFITTGKLDLGNFFNMIKTEMARTFVRQTIMRPITESLGGIFGSIFGGGSNESGQGAAGSVTKGNGITISQNILSGFGNGISKLGSFFNSAAMTGWGQNFANGAAGQMLGASAGMGPTVAGSATGIGSQVGSWASKAGSFMSSYGGYISAGLQLMQGNVKGAMFTAAGAAIGSIIPGIGTLVGAAVGSMLGGLIGGGVKTQKFSSGISGTYSDGKFSSSDQLGGIAGYKKSLGSLSGMSGVLKAYSESISTIMTAYGLDGTVNTGIQAFQRSGKKSKAWGYFGASAGGGSATFSSGNDPFANMQDAMNALIEKIMTEGITSLIASSKLPEGIRMLFSGLSDKTQIQNMLVAAINLADAQELLMDKYVLTASDAGKVAVATGLAGDQLVEFVNKLVTTTMSLGTYGEVLLREQGKIFDRFESIMGNTSVPTTLKAFDDALKGIDKTTEEGIQQFAELFQLRDVFGSMVNTIDGLKGSVRDALYQMVSPSEQLAMRQENLAKIFGDLNMQIPGSMEELIALGKSIDFTSAEGLTLASVFPTLVQAFADTKAAADALINTLIDPRLFRNQFEYNRAQSLISRYGVDKGSQFLQAALPSFDVGTNYVPHDMVARIHKGERIIPAADNADLIGGSSDVAYEIIQLREDQRVMLISMTRSLASIERKIAKIDIDGIKLSEYDTSGNPTVINVREVV